ncbi:MAG: NUDIX domain-containing protein [Candidatus Aenigmatarchaeota archaeon]
MVKERFTLIPTSHLILTRGDKILLLRRFNTGWMDGNYSVVAGHLDGNETFLEAMAREAKEEAGIEINTEDMNVVHVMHRKVPDAERIDVFIRADKWGGEIKNMEPGKCDDLSWFEINKLPENTIPYIRQAINKIEKRIIYSEHGWQ